MKKSLFWLSLWPTLLIGCASRPVAGPTVTERMRADAVQAQYRALQEAHQPASDGDAFEDITVPLPERTEEGIIHTPGSIIVRIPRTP